MALSVRIRTVFQNDLREKLFLLQRLLLSRRELSPNNFLILE